MKTKQEILKKCCEGESVLFSDGDVYDGFTGPLERAMDEFAKQQSKEFLVWADSNAARDGMHSWSIGAGRATKVYSTDQLYDLFIETQQNNG